MFLDQCFSRIQITNINVYKYIYIFFFLQGLYTEGGDMNHELSDMDLLNVDGPAAHRQSYGTRFVS